MWNVCRTCATKQIEMISIFDQDKSPSIAAMITAISSLEILPNDRLPSEICITCFETLEMTYYFKQQVTRCNDTLLTQVHRTTLLARCKMLARQEANNEVAVKKQMEEFVSNEHMIVNSGDVATEKVADELSECHDPLMMEHDTYDSSKCEESLNFAMPLTNMACDDLPEGSYIKDVNFHLEEREYKPEINELDVKEHGVQFGDNCEITPREMIFNNVADVEFCSDDDSPLTSMRESIRNCKVSENVQENSNENAEGTGEAFEGLMLKESYIKVVNSHLEETEYKPEINKIDIEEHGVQFGDNCEISSREISKNVADVVKLCSDDDLPLTSMRETTRNYHVSQNDPDNSNENAEVTGEAFEGGLKDAGNLSTDKSFKCTCCNKLFIRKSSLQTHMHKHTNPFKCEICQKVYVAPSHLKVHMRSHTGERPFHCQECNSKFYSKGELNQHMVRHTGEKPFHCQQCNSKFYSKGELKQHMQRHTGEKPFHCQLCNSTFHTKSDLSKHMRSHTGEVKPKPHRCGVYGDSIGVPSLLQHHMTTHTRERPFHCQECNLKFYSKGNLKQHMLRHTDEKPFHCPQCYSKFYSKGNLKQHMLRHTDEKSFHCQHCNWKFYSKGDLKQHMRRHTGESTPKPHRIDVCADSFDAPSHLKHYIRSHTSEIKYNDTLHEFERSQDENP